MKKYLLIFLFMSLPCFGQDIKPTPTPELKLASLDIKRFKSAVRQEQAKTPLSVVKVGENYDSTGGIYKSITKASLKESFPFGIEFDGKHFRLEPLSVEFDNYEQAVDLTAYKENTTKASAASKTANILTYPAVGGVTYSVFADTEKWRKVVTIDPKQLLIPKGAKYLILSFKVDTDFNLPKGRTSNRFEMTEDCWLEPAKVGIVGSTEYITIEHEFSAGVYYKYIPVESLNKNIFTDADITFGSEEVFKEAVSYETYIESSSPTSGVIVYYYSGVGGGGTAIAYTLSGTDFTFGTEEVFNAGDSPYLSVSASSTTSGVIVYRDSGNSYYGTIIAYTLSGTDFTFGTEEVFNAGNTPGISVSATSTTTGVIAYRDYADGDGAAIAYTLSGTDFTFGTEETFCGSIIPSVSLSTISATSGVISYRDEGISSYGLIVAYTLSGTDFTFGTPEIFNSAQTNFINVSATSSTSGVISYQDVGSYYGQVIAYTLSGTDFTFGTEEVFNSAQTNFISLSATSSTSGVICYYDGGNSGYGISITYTLNVTDFTFGSEQVFNAGVSYDVRVSTASPYSFHIVYRDMDNSGYGTAICGTTPIPPSTQSPAAALIELLYSQESTQ